MTHLKLDIELSDKQFEFEASLDKFNVTGYGGAKGGGKSFSGRMIPIIRCLENPGHVGALFRKSYPEIEDNHLTPMFRLYPELRAYYNSQQHTLRFPSLESEFKFRYCKNLKEVDDQAGREYHTLVIEEAGDWEYEMAIRLIRNCNRSSQPGVKATAALMFNWGGLGHGYLKRIFWDRRLHPNEKNLTWNFILAKLEDNPKLIENDPGYVARLEAEPNEALRRAHRDGDPNIIAGQFFTELNYEVHVLKPFPIPSHWKWFGSYDYGFGHPAVWLFWVTDENGNVYLVDEIYKARTYIEDQARLVHEKIKGFIDSKQKNDKSIIFQAGLDCWANKSANSKTNRDVTIAEDFMNASIVGNNKIILQRANVQRVLGAKQVRQYLRYSVDPNGKQQGPKVFLFDRCELTLGCLQRMVHDPDNVEDVLKVDSSNGDPETGDDGYDAFRYGLMSRPSLAIPVEKSTLDRYRRSNIRGTSWQTV